MRKIVLVVIGGLFATSIASISYAQTQTAKACEEAQAGFISVMGLFRSAYFEREDTAGTAESVMADQVVPSAESVYAVCPDNTNAAIEEVVKRSYANLNDPNRPQLVQCDKAFINYRRAIAKFDSSNLAGGYTTYRSALNTDIKPAANEAIEACPQMTELTQQTNVEIAERQRRLDQMEDIDNALPSISDNRDASNALAESLEDDE